MLTGLRSLKTGVWHAFQALCQNGGLTPTFLYGLKRVFIMCRQTPTPISKGENQAQGSVKVYQERG